MGQDVKVALGDQEYRPQEISAMILRALQDRAQKALGREVQKAVITVPAYFHDAQRQATIEAGQLAGLARRLPLGVVEVRRDGDDRLRHRRADCRRRPVAELAEDHGRDFLRPILLVAEPDLDVLAHLPLDRLDGPLGGEGVLVAGRLADEQPPVLGQPDERGQDRVAVLLEHDRLAVADDGDLAVGRPQVDTDDHFGHGPSGGGKFESARPSFSVRRRRRVAVAFFPLGTRAPATPRRERTLNEDPFPHYFTGTSRNSIGPPQQSQMPAS
jgi:hypothetical protein